MTIEPHDASQHFQVEPFWSQRFIVKDGKFVVAQLRAVGRDRLPTYAVESDAASLCWRASRQHFAGHAFNAIPVQDFPLHGWWRSESQVAFRLSDFAPITKPIGGENIGVLDTPTNALLELNFASGARLVVPTLTVLTALVFATPSIMQSLLCPGEFGFERCADSSTEDLLVIQHSGGLPVRPMHTRAVECLAFWLEHPQRRASLDQVFFNAFEGGPAVLPKLGDEVFRFRFSGYRKGDTFVLERLGQLRGQQIWERGWRRCEVRCEAGKLRGWAGVALGSLQAKARAA